MLGTIHSIEEVHDVRLGSISPLEGSGGRLGLAQMLTHALGGYASMDGYVVTTDAHSIHVLIDNQQSCCESWGYVTSEDDIQHYIGATLWEINLTDTALNQQRMENSGWYEGEGGIQFIDFATTQGTFQIAVYNSHNGYYGHGVVIAKDAEILFNDTL